MEEGKRVSDRECKHVENSQQGFIGGGGEGVGHSPCPVDYSILLCICDKRDHFALNAKFYRFSSTHHSDSPLATGSIFGLLAVQAFY